jgi:hypothetical protein
MKTVAISLLKAVRQEFVIIILVSSAKRIGCALFCILLLPWRYSPEWARASFFLGFHPEGFLVGKCAFCSE